MFVHIHQPCSLSQARRRSHCSGRIWSCTCGAFSRPHIMRGGTQPTRNDVGRDQPRCSRVTRVQFVPMCTWPGRCKVSARQRPSVEIRAPPYAVNGIAQEAAHEGSPDGDWYASSRQLECSRTRGCPEVHSEHRARSRCRDTDVPPSVAIARQSPLFVVCGLQ
jgi:hypothetical protein